MNADVSVKVAKLLDCISNMEWATNRRLHELTSALVQAVGPGWLLNLQQKPDPQNDFKGGAKNTRGVN